MNRFYDPFVNKFYNEKPMMSNIAFSHRKEAGVSIGVYKHKKDMIIAGAFLSPGDQFSKREARKVLADRIQKVIDGEEPKFVMGVRGINHYSASMISRLIRQFFKPDPEEVDDLFFNVVQFEDIHMRTRVDHRQAWNIIYNIVKTMASEGAFANESVNLL